MLRLSGLIVIHCRVNQCRWSRLARACKTIQAVTKVLWTRFTISVQSLIMEIQQRIRPLTDRYLWFNVVRTDTCLIPLARGCSGEMKSRLQSCSFSDYKARCVGTAQPSAATGPLGACQYQQHAPIMPYGRWTVTDNTRRSLLLFLSSTAVSVSFVCQQSQSKSVEARVLVATKLGTSPPCSHCCIMRYSCIIEQLNYMIQILKETIHKCIFN